MLERRVLLCRQVVVIIIETFITNKTNVFTSEVGVVRDQALAERSINAVASSLCEGFAVFCLAAAAARQGQETKTIAHASSLHCTTSSYMMEPKMEMAMAHCCGVSLFD
jgi:hypothetical protein